MAGTRGETNPTVVAVIGECLPDPARSGHASSVPAAEAHRRAHCGSLPRRGRASRPRSGSGSASTRACARFRVDQRVLPPQRGVAAREGAHACSPRARSSTCASATARCCVPRTRARARSCARTDPSSSTAGSETLCSTCRAICGARLSGTWSIRPCSRPSAGSRSTRRRRRVGAHEAAHGARADAPLPALGAAARRMRGAHSTADIAVLRERIPDLSIANVIDGGDVEYFSPEHVAASANGGRQRPAVLRQPRRPAERRRRRAPRRDIMPLVWRGAPTRARSSSARSRPRRCAISRTGGA